MPPRRGTTPWASSRGPLPSDRIRPPELVQPALPAKSEKEKPRCTGSTSSLLASVHRPLLGPPSTRTMMTTKRPRLRLRIQGVASAKVRAPLKCPNRRYVYCGAACAHVLSEYMPLCTTSTPCPHCAKPLLVPPACAELIVQLEEQRVHALAEEANDPH
ncbi:hypothetical protein BJV78DRAFT_1217537 [Lactifluus subvellereus]|nr:hypothetical protein BJV78DRAFT_1217537 [Lactifluus subvellereus]